MKRRESTDEELLLKWWRGNFICGVLWRLIFCDLQKVQLLKICSTLILILDTVKMPSTNNKDKPWDTGDVDKWKVSLPLSSTDHEHY